MGANLSRPFPDQDRSASTTLQGPATQARPLQEQPCCYLLNIYWLKIRDCDEPGTVDPLSLVTKV